jgi:Fe-S-cluster containining protein
MVIKLDICKTCKGYHNDDGTYSFCCTGCKDFDEKTGCKLTYENRPFPCQIFPYVYRDKDLYICLTCPNWKEFIIFEEEAKERLKEHLK